MKMNEELLLDLADKLERFQETAPDVKFDMHHFVQRSDCGTAACALGTAALKGWLPNVGLAYTSDDVYPTIKGKITNWEYICHTVLGLRRNSESLNKCFMPCYYVGVITPAMVAARIREVVATEGAA